LFNKEQAFIYDNTAQGFIPDRLSHEYSQDALKEILALELRFKNDLDERKRQFVNSFQYRVYEILKLVDPLQKGFIDFEKLEKILFFGLKKKYLILTV
jgi:hypothetical protein